jgi:long-chain acyl-CoA synthetase
MQHRVSLWRTALANENLETGARIALMLPNCPEWVCLDLAAHSLGLVVVPLYVNDRPENVAYILEDTEAKVFICPGLSCWEHLAPVFKRLHGLQRIITIDFCQPIKDDSRITCISDWLPETPAPDPDHYPAPDDTATIVYTSGTTGAPKGVMLSHRNMISNAFASLQCMNVYRHDLFLSFLPLSHMLERMAGYYLPMMAGATIAFARSIPELSEDLLAIKPTIMVAVPRIFERIYSGMMDKIDKSPVMLQKLFHAAVKVGWQQFEYKQKRAAWSPAQLLNPLLDTLVAKKVRAKLGGRLRIIISGGAPLSPDIAKVFIGLGLPIYQGYGLTETSPVISVNIIDNNDPTGVGLPLPGLEVKIGKFDELLVRGNCVMQGYWNRPEATAQTIDVEGWLHTGDRAAFVNDHIKITGRLKEIIVLSNGEKVSPNDVEQAISMDPLFEQSMVVGEGRPHLVLLAVLAKERWGMLAEELGVSPDEASLRQEKVQQAVLKRVEQLMHNQPGYAFIKQVVLSLEPWTVEHGLLTPTLKIRRQSVMSHLQGEIDKLYKL